MKNLLFFALLLCSLWACPPQQTPPPVDPPVEEEAVMAVGFDGQKLMAINDPPVIRMRKDSLLRIAQANYTAQPNDLQNIIWYGRRLSYLTRYPEAIEVYTKGIALHPEAPELYRHRGHRYISTRQTELAIADLLKAAELSKDLPIQIEPDGQPNALNIPLSSLQFNIWYHLGLAYYLQQDYKEAQAAFEECMQFSTNPDLLCATTDWLYMTYRRRGLTEKPAQLLEAISPDMELIENKAYHKRLLLYKGLLRPEEIISVTKSGADRQLEIATQGYGVGNWYLYNDQSDKAMDIFRRVLETSYWPAFGYIAAEAELNYLKKRAPELLK
ncbi:MAG: tetratricopeptide repeat protein [Bacteroidota bacterium]